MKIFHQSFRLDTTTVTINHKLGEGCVLSPTAVLGFCIAAIPGRVMGRFHHIILVHNRAQQNFKHLVSWNTESLKARVAGPVGDVDESILSRENIESTRDHVPAWVLELKDWGVC